MNERIIELIKQLQDDDEKVRWEAANALGNAYAEAKAAIPALVVPALIETLNDGNSAVGAYASESLVKIGLEAVPALMEALQDGNVATRVPAAWALNKIKKENENYQINLQMMKISEDAFEQAVDEVALSIEKYFSKYGDLPSPGMLRNTISSHIQETACIKEVRDVRRTKTE